MGVDNYVNGYVQKIAMFVRVDVLPPRKTKGSSVGMFSWVHASTEQ